MQNVPVPGFHRPFSAAFGSDNKSYLYEYGVPHTSIYQKARLNGIPGSGSSILHQYVWDVFLSYVSSAPVVKFGVELAQAPKEFK